MSPTASGRAAVGRGLHAATWRWCRASRRAASRSARCARITAAERNVVLALDGEPALRCLLRDLGADAGRPAHAAAQAAQPRWSGLSDGRPSRCSAAARCSAPTRACATWSALDPGAPGGGRGRPCASRACAWRSASATWRRRGATWCASAARSATNSARTWTARVVPAAAAPPAACTRRRPPATSQPTHPRRALRQLHRPRRAALRRAVGRAADRAPRAGRRAAGRLLRRAARSRATTCTATPGC